MKFETLRKIRVKRAVQHNVHIFSERCSGLSIEEKHSIILPSLEWYIILKTEIMYIWKS